MDDDRKKWDFKQISAGAGGSVLALFLLQDRGLDFVNQKNIASNQVVIEKTVANSHRIEALERQMNNFSNKLEGNFEMLRMEIKKDIESIRKAVINAGTDRYTRLDHDNYADTITDKFRVIDEKIDLLRSRIREVEKDTHNKSN